MHQSEYFGYTADNLEDIVILLLMCIPALKCSGVRSIRFASCMQICSENSALCSADDQTLADVERTGLMSNGSSFSGGQK